MYNMNTQNFEKSETNLITQLINITRLFFKLNNCFYILNGLVLFSFIFKNVKKITNNQTLKSTIYACMFVYTTYTSSILYINQFLRSSTKIQDNYITYRFQTCHCKLANRIAKFATLILRR